MTGWGNPPSRGRVLPRKHLKVSSPQTLGWHVLRVKVRQMQIWTLWLRADMSVARFFAEFISPFWNSAIKKTKSKAMKCQNNPSFRYRPKQVCCYEQQQSFDWFGFNYGLFNFYAWSLYGTGPQGERKAPDQPKAARKAKQKKSWTADRVEVLLKYIKDCKTKYDINGIDFPVYVFSNHVVTSRKVNRDPWVVWLHVDESYW